MTLKEKTFTIELTEEEIELLHKAANEMYKKYKPIAEDGETVEERIQAGKLSTPYRHLRDALANMVGTRYMGSDA